MIAIHTMDSSVNKLKIMNNIFSDKAVGLQIDTQTYIQIFESIFSGNTLQNQTVLIKSIVSNLAMGDNCEVSNNIVSDKALLFQFFQSDVTIQSLKVANTFKKIT